MAGETPEIWNALDEETQATIYAALYEGGVAALAVGDSEYTLDLMFADDAIDSFVKEAEKLLKNSTRGYVWGLVKKEVKPDGEMKVGQIIVPRDKFLEKGKDELVKYLKEHLEIKNGLKIPPMGEDK